MEDSELETHHCQFHPSVRVDAYQHKVKGIDKRWLTLLFDLHTNPFQQVNQ